MSAKSDLLAKARRGEPITIEDKLSVIETVADVRAFRDALARYDLDTPDNLAAVARRLAFLEKHRK